MLIFAFTCRKQTKWLGTFSRRWNSDWAEVLEDAAAKDGRQLSKAPNGLMLRTADTIDGGARASIASRCGGSE